LIDVQAKCKIKASTAQKPSRSAFPGAFVWAAQAALMAAGGVWRRVSIIIAGRY
jgi:hypothetical protein